jgi:predicted exporter
MPPRARTTFVVALAVLALLGLFVALKIDVTTDISEFMPTGEDRAKARIATAVAQGPLSKSLVVTVEAADPNAAAEASRVLEEEIRADEDLLPLLAYIDSGPPVDVDRTLWEIYHPRRLAFAAATPQQARHLVSDEGLVEAAADIHRRLQSPLSTLVTKAAPDDPFLAVPRLFEGLQEGAGRNVAVIDGRFVAQERYAVLFLGTEAGSLDADAQREIIAGIGRAYDRLATRVDVGPLESSGLGKFSIVAEETIKSDIRRNTVLSIVGLLLLCVVVLRSVRLAFLVGIPIGCAMLCATATSLLIYGRVHGLTLAFGAALIGVCIDYVVHLYVHQVQHPHPDGPFGTLDRIWPALLLGSGTTAVGFAVIAGSSFPGLREVAIFATVGVAGALLGTRWLLPPLLPKHPATNALRDRMCVLLAAGFARLRRGRRASWVLLVGALVVSAIGIPTVQWQDDMKQMGRLDPQMLAEDERVRARVAQLDQGRFVVAVASSEEDALRINDEVAQALQAAVEAGELGAYHSVASLLPSAARQQEIDRTIRETGELRARFTRVFDEAGFNAELFAPFFAYLEQPPPEAVTYADLAESAAAGLVRSLRMPVEDDVGFLSLVREVEDPAALAARLDAIEGATYIDHVALMKRAVEDYRRRTVRLLVIGLFAVMAVLAIRYRAPRVVLATIAPAVLAGGVTIAALAALGLKLDLVGLTAVLMVLSIGVDYGVFLAETDRLHPEGLPATLLGLVVCWASTVIGFGALTLSAHPVMKTIGVVAAVGVTASLLLAPTTLALLPGGRR